MDELEFTRILEKKKRNFHRLIVKTNSSSMSEERMEILRKKINDPSYISYAIDKLAENISKAMLEGYLDQKDN
ncbi:MAG: hypothetical protein N2258_07695 [Brevinematales bacterium]|nr:hypothetical protein [Brevinematales bacterium]